MISRLFKISTALLVLFLLVPVIYKVSGVNQNGAVCSPGNVKYEIDSGYEYNDGSADISGDADEVCWEANEGYQVTSVCLKIGGEEGGSPIMLGPGDGCGGPYEYGISHAVVYTGPLASPSPNPSPSPSAGPCPSECPWPSLPPFPSFPPCPSSPPCPSPSPSAQPSPSPSCPPRPSPSPSACPSPSPSACPSPSPSPEPSPSAEPSPSPEPSPSAKPSPSAPPVGGDGPKPGPPVCGAETPPVPNLLSVTPSTSVDLSWTAVSPVTHYSIAYGESPGDYQYGVDNTGNVTNFNVGGLDPAKDYCFAVRAVHDCAPSELSNEICTGGVGGQVLGATTLADTGNALDQLMQILFIMGSVCLSLGLKIFPSSVGTPKVK